MGEPAALGPWVPAFAGTSGVETQLVRPERADQARILKLLAYVIRRILATIPVMGVVALFVFSLLYLSPGDPAAIIAGDQATTEVVERIRQQLGLDEPFLIQFGSWLWRLLHGDLGISIFTNLPVSLLIFQRMEPTIALTVSPCWCQSASPFRSASWRRGEPAAGSTAS